jgi:hypothetical protein
LQQPHVCVASAVGTAQQHSVRRVCVRTGEGITRGVFMVLMQQAAVYTVSPPTTTSTVAAVSPLLMCCLCCRVMPGVRASNAAVSTSVLVSVTARCKCKWWVGCLTQRRHHPPLSGAQAHKPGCQRARQSHTRPVDARDSEQSTQTIWKRATAVRRACVQTHACAASAAGAGASKLPHTGATCVNLCQL